MKKLHASTIQSIYTPRKPDTHKGDYGHALLIAGNEGKMGAAVIAARACLRSGVGLLTVNVPREERFILQTAIPEAMLMMRTDLIIDKTEFAAVGIGCGIGTGKSSLELLQQLLEQFRNPMVIDADALNIVASHKSMLKKIPHGSILTPHPLEFDRLFGKHETPEARIETAIQMAQQSHCIIVLKGHKTIITDGNKTYRNTTGNAALAKGGSGDALTGMITSFLAQGYCSFEAAQLGVYLHGAAADIALKKQSKESMLITDVIEHIGDAFKLIAGK